MARTIMIGTKDPNIAYLLQRYAEESGFRTVDVRPDKDVVDQACDLQPSLIILDVESGNLAEQQLVRRLKSEPTTQRVPVVGYSYLDEFPEALRAQIDGYLSKAVMYDDFIAIVTRVGLSPSANDTQASRESHTRGGARVAEQTPGNNVLLQVKDLKMHFPIKRGLIFTKQIGTVRAVDGVNFFIREGETLGLVGESGCGKTTTGRLVLRAYEPTGGEVWFRDRKQGLVNVPTLEKEQLHTIRQNMQLIFQDPYSSLNPRMTLLEIVGEPLYVNKVAEGKALKDRVAELLSVVGLRPEYMGRYPHAFSGGQRQRIGVARALALNPQLIVCDEPVSALDVSVQAQILNLLQELQEKFGLTYLFISHDLSVVEHISNRVAVMYVGKLVEHATTEELYTNPRHPYTEALLSAVPKPDPRVRPESIVLPGEVADPSHPPTGCYFHPRCRYRIDRCTTEEPSLRQVAPDHFVSCHRAEELQLIGVLGQTKLMN